MNRFPPWKYALLVIVIGLGLVYALPNLYGEDPAVQVSSIRGFELDQNMSSRVETILDTAGIEYGQIEFAPQRLLVRLGNVDRQTRAADALRDSLGEDYVVALNLAPATPPWLQTLGAAPMVLGLDLQGGVHFLMQVDMDTARTQQLERYVTDIRNILRDNGIRYRSVRMDRNEVVAELRSADDRDEALSLVNRELEDLVFEQNEGSETFNFRATVDEEALLELQRTALRQNITTLRNRVNELGVSEPIIQQQGADRIVVQLPGVQDTARAKQVLGSTATVEYRGVDEQNDPFEAQRTGRIPPQSRLYFDRNDN